MGQPQPRQEAPSGLVLHGGRPERNARDDEVIDHSRQADPGPCRGGQKHAVRRRPEGVEAAGQADAPFVDDGGLHPRPELFGQAVAGAQDEDPPALPRLLDRARDVAQMRRVRFEMHRLRFGGIILSLPERAGHRAVGEPEPHPAVLPGLEVVPSLVVDPRRRLHPLNARQSQTIAPPIRENPWEPTWERQNRNIPIRLPIHIVTRDVPAEVGSIA